MVQQQGNAAGMLRRAFYPGDQDLQIVGWTQVLGRPSTLVINELIPDGNTPADPVSRELVCPVGVSYNSPKESGPVL